MCRSEATSQPSLKHGYAGEEQKCRCTLHIPKIAWVSPLCCTEYTWLPV